jgi:hypothetical protein
VWNDHSLGLEERITHAAIRLSNNQSVDLTLRNDAMRAIGGNLTNLRKAMALHRRGGVTQKFYNHSHHP